MQKYFFEIQNRLKSLCITCLVTFCLNIYHKEILLFIVLQPATIFSCDFSVNISYFIFTEVTEILFVNIKLAIFLTSQIFLLMIGLHFFNFISSALFFREHLCAKYCLKLTFFAWFFFNTIMFWFVMPFTWKFFLHFQKLIISQSFHLYFEIKLAECFHFYSGLYYNYVKLCFLSVACLFFFKVTNFEKLQKQRKLHHFCLVLLVGFLDSTPDFFLQFSFCVFSILIYELILLISAVKFSTNFSYTFKALMDKRWVSIPKFMSSNLIKRIKRLIIQDIFCVCKLSNC